MDYLHAPAAPPSPALPKTSPLKQPMAVLAAPTRSLSAWANVKTSKLSRSARRFILIRSTTLSVCATDNPRTALLSLAITGASMMQTSGRCETYLRAGPHKLWIQWDSDHDMRTYKAAFEFANRHIDEYYKLVTHRQLGKGRNSEVVFAFDTSTGDHSAVKIINKDKAKSSDREFAEKEVCIRMTVQHPCIVQTIDIFETPYDLFVVMELMNGSSLDRRMLKYNEPLTEHQARVVMCRLFSALRHLHSRGIVHRNVKPDNLYLDSPDELRWPYTVKLSDFSLACFLDDPHAHKQVVGTPEFLAPCATIMTRATSGERTVMFGTEVDMWAAGVTLYNLLSKDFPFEGDNPSQVFKKARLGSFYFTDAFDDVSDSAKSLIRALLNVDNRKRPTAQTVLLHPWFEPLIEFSGAVDCGNYELIDDGAITHAPCVFESFEEYALSDGIRRFRYAAVAVIMMVRLCNIKLGGFFPENRHQHRMTAGLPPGPMSMSMPMSMSLSSSSPHEFGAGGSGAIEKRFQFNVSGIDIAPMHSLLEHAMAQHDGDLTDDVYMKMNMNIHGSSSHTSMERSSANVHLGPGVGNTTAGMGARVNRSSIMSNTVVGGGGGVHDDDDDDNNDDGNGDSGGDGGSGGGGGIAMNSIHGHGHGHSHSHSHSHSHHIAATSDESTAALTAAASTNSAKDFGEGSLYVLQGRASGTVMSRVSTGSTVKSRSSRGTEDCVVTSTSTTCGATVPTMTSTATFNSSYPPPPPPPPPAPGYTSTSTSRSAAGNSRASARAADLIKRGPTTTAGAYVRGVTNTTRGLMASSSAALSSMAQQRRRSDIKMERSDTSVDYFGQRGRGNVGGDSGGGGGGGMMVAPQERMLSDTADLVTNAGMAVTAAAAVAAAGGGATMEDGNVKGKWRRRRRILHN